MFISSTACIGDMPMKYLFRLILPIGRLFGLMPLVTIFNVDDLVQGLNDAGFEIEQQWQPGRGKAVFIVARKR